MVLRVMKTKHPARRIANEYFRRHRPWGPAPIWAERPRTLLLQSWFSGSLNIIIQLNCLATSQYSSGCPRTGQLLHGFHPEFPFCLLSHQRIYSRLPASVVSLKFVYKMAKGQMQILRLTTPKLHPKEQRSLFGPPGTERRLGPLSLRMTGHFMLWTIGTGH